MKKAILKVFSVVALAALMLYNVQLSGSINDGDYISLFDLGQTASAQSENQDPCGGGSCSFTKYRNDGKTVDWSCTVCCPAGKTPDCSIHGCKC